MVAADYTQNYQPIPYTFEPSNRTATWLLPPAQLRLTPAKALRHVHDAVTLTALVLDDNGAAVPGVRVLFTARGDCDVELAPKNATTDAAGRASVVVTGKGPGAAIVVATATNAAGTPLLSADARTIFGDGRKRHGANRDDYYEERDRDY